MASSSSMVEVELWNEADSGSIIREQVSYSMAAE